MVAKLRLHGPSSPLSGTSTSKQTASNSGTIAPRLNVPRSPPLALLGHVEHHRRRRTDLAGGDLRLERRGLALGAGRVVLVEAEEDVRRRRARVGQARQRRRSIPCCVDDLAEIVEEPATGVAARRAPTAPRASGAGVRRRSRRAVRRGAWRGSLPTIGRRDSRSEARRRDVRADAATAHTGSVPLDGAIRALRRRRLDHARHLAHRLRLDRRAQLPPSAGRRAGGEALKDDVADLDTSAPLSPRRSSAAPPSPLLRLRSEVIRATWTSSARRLLGRRHRHAGVARVTTRMACH